ncbi:exosortase A [Rhodospirillaceae bacterium SYSU D60014]|uniref:exosortase A n=1 Tax=Virgifigura deserti TaxID=2268457 RepID=UPI000E66BFDE
MIDHADSQAESRLPERMRIQAWTRAIGWFGVLVALLLALLTDVVLAMATTWWNTTTYNHGFLILPISLFLIWLRRAELRTMIPEQEPLALLLVLGAGLVWLVGRAADVMLVQYFGLIGMIVSLFLFAFGRWISLKLAFPLLFLFFMVPIGNALIPPLQQFTAAFSVGLLRIVGIPVFQDGIFIQIPNGLFEVAEACAGVRFLIANIVVVTLFAYLAYTKWWKWVVFLALGFVVPIIANGLRAFGIIIVAHLTDNSVAAGVDHIIYGWGFFAAVMLVLLLIGNLFADRPVGQFVASSSGRTRAAGRQTRHWRTGTAIVALLVTLAAPVYALTMMRPPATTTIAGGTPLAINPSWTRLETQAPVWLPQFDGADRLVLESYRSDDATIDFFVAYYIYQRQGAEAVYYANSFHDGEVWRRAETGSARLQHPSLPDEVNRDRIVSGSTQRLVLSWYWVGGEFTADPITAKLLQVRARLLGSDPSAAVIAVAADFHQNPQDAKAAIESFLSGMAPLAPYLESLGATEK